MARTVKPPQLEFSSAPTVTLEVAADHVMISDTSTGLSSKVTVADLLSTTEKQGEAYAINTQTGTSYTLLLTDKGKIIEMNNASANTLTVPPNSSVAFPVNSRIDIVQYGAGQTTIAAGAGVTIRSSGGKLKITGQYSSASLYKRGTDEWVLIGDITT